MDHKGSCPSSGTWADITKNYVNIVRLGIPLDTSFVRKVANGAVTKFWKDIWCNAGSQLMEMYPRLYALEKNKEFVICER